MNPAAIRCLPFRPLPCLRLCTHHPQPHAVTVTPRRSISRLHAATSSLPIPLSPAEASGEGSADLHERRVTVVETLKCDVKGMAIKCALAVGICTCIACIAPSVASAASTVVQSTGFSLMNALKGFIDFVLHLDVHLGAIIAKHGAWSYAFLFTIVFCETGLVLTPFLPGDSLLFVAGALAGIGKLNLFIVSMTFIVAAVVGDAVNYAIGAWLGERAVENQVISKAYIQKTEQFFESYGGKTIVLARFVPIVRTFAPFVAGMSRMEYQRFAAFNVGGALLWTFLFCGVGFFFGNLPFVEKNFSLVVFAIVAISVLPIVYEILAARGQHQTPSSPQT